MFEVIGPQTSDGPIRIEFSIEPCSKSFDTGHPKFGAEREVRASPWGLALAASRLDAPRVPTKPFRPKKKVGVRLEAVSTCMS